MSAQGETSRLIEVAFERLLGDVGRPPGIATSSVSTARTEMLRVAWGTDAHSLSAAALLALASGLPTQIQVDPSGLAPDCVFPPPIARIVLNLLLLGADSLPAGGIIFLAGSANDLFLRIDGPAASWPSGMSACLRDETAAAAAMKGGAVQMSLTMLLAQAAGMRLSFLLPPAGAGEPAILRMGGA